MPMKMPIRCVGVCVCVWRSRSQCCGGGGGGSALRSGDKTFLRSDPNGTMARYALVDSDNDNANGNKMDTTTTDSIIGENNARDHRCTTASLWKRPWTNSVGE
mmetsp:Transcript_25560/g.53280  ORF Transcript_25560/g.53280 Transcript_25560/m.53280 type:complete len:103 (-) Transcript_25560:40-348(-)